LAKIFIVIGVIFIIIGLLLYLKIPFFKLPGDIVIEKENFTFYFPITSSILISLFLSIFLTLFFKVFK
jgi:hypothetical protein